VSKKSSQKYPYWKKIIFSELNRDNKNWFGFYLNQASRADLVRKLGIISIDNFRFHGYIKASGKNDWHLIAFLKSRVTLECRLTLNPFPLSLNTRVERRFIADSNLLSPQKDFSIPEDETLELLTPTYDLYELVKESLFLEVPDYPTSSDSKFDSSINDDNGHMRENDNRDNPFAALVRSNS